MWYGQFKLLDDCPNSIEEAEKRKPTHMSHVLLDDDWAGTYPDVGYCNSFPTGFVFFQLKEKSLKLLHIFSTVSF